MFRNATVLGALPALMLAFSLGCSDSAPQTQVSQAPAPPPPPPKPKVLSVEELMAQLNISDKIMLPEDKAPGTTAERKAVLELFDGFARGDDQVVASYISHTDRVMLQDMVDSGAWKKATDGITQIRVETGLSPEGETCALAVIQTGMQFQPQLWMMAPGSEKDYTFDSVYTPPDMMNKLSGTDWIAAWFDIKNAELELANVPDEDLMPAQQILDDGTGDVEAGNIPSRSPGGSPGRGPARAPGGPSGPAVAPGRGPNAPGKK